MAEGAEKCKFDLSQRRKGQSSSEAGDNMHCGVQSIPTLPSTQLLFERLIFVGNVSHALPISGGSNRH